MREIKFRAWDTVNKQMYARPFIIDQSGRVFFHYDGGGQIQKHLVLMQYTGLKDKNGKEIYEGDIVHNKSLSKKGIVKYDNFKNQLGEYHGWYIYRPMKIGKDKVDTWESPHWIVIGNIYENPELINH